MKRKTREQLQIAFWIMLGAGILGVIISWLWPHLKAEEFKGAVRGLMCVLYLLAAVAIAILRYVYHRKRRKRFQAGLCLQCGYDLHAHETGERCPECGTVVLSKREHFPRPFGK